MDRVGQTATPDSDTGAAASITPDVFFRALKAALWITAFFVPFAWVRFGWTWAGAFAFFSVWNVANLFLLARILLDAVNRRPKGRIALQGAALFVLVVILLLFFGMIRPSVSTFLCGFHLPYVVLAMKVIGWRMTHRAGRVQPAGAPSDTKQAKEDG